MVSAVRVPTSFADLSREDLAVLVPELLLCGHLIDRSGMPHLIGAFGREGMTQVAIEEWMAASPIYTKRMQRALAFEGDGVVTIFKGLQLDIGAPPQFMDFRYRVIDHDHGEFWLDHCGALMDVEPMGDEYVTSMCHDIEDPTFDATALATNPHAQVRPVHRPPRRPADRTPHCKWTVTIDDAHTPPPVPEGLVTLGRSRAAAVELSPIDTRGPGRHDYSDALLSDLRFSDFSHSALVRMAEEVCLQQHLLTLGFLLAVRSRTDEESAMTIARRQFTGIAGLTSERIRNALGLPGDLEGLAAVLAIHPAFNPRQYVEVTTTLVDRLFLTIRRAGGSDADGAWPSMIDGAHLEPLDALLRGVSPRFSARVIEETDTALTVEVVTGEAPAKEASEVALTRFSTGADFAFTDRGIPLPLSVV
ncbi:hypothetical protein CBI38_04935 [Rhodococcus oxybenzonivorans]|uniref:Uncharacterized protein n=1 Tax=Rhodococcus oxybenzonivorans TaxID=1990687 RepID=A0A2S2BQZ6_9NOCA|nr:hypothetical protein CBI38_04935 [Rhodococcus oxybenzonivorans]QTJ66073.1 hypothetical protein HYG77_11005 [Rhodococcus sp. ZPP]